MVGVDPINLNHGLLRASMQVQRESPSRVYELAYDTIKDYDGFEPRFYDYIGKKAIQ